MEQRKEDAEARENYSDIIKIIKDIKGDTFDCREFDVTDEIPILAKGADGKEYFARYKVVRMRVRDEIYGTDEKKNPKKQATAYIDSEWEFFWQFEGATLRDSIA